jgi:tetratricopeptide (TPR) repeat protein
VNALIDRMFETQTLARAGRYEDALEKLRAIEREAPQLAAVYELQGGVYYLMNRYREALDAYSLAAKLNPANPQITRMRQVLETALSSQREPASAQPGKILEGAK